MLNHSHNPLLICSMSALQPHGLPFAPVTFQKHQFLANHHPLSGFDRGSAVSPCLLAAVPVLKPASSTFMCQKDLDMLFKYSYSSSTSMVPTASLFTVSPIILLSCIYICLMFNISFINHLPSQIIYLKREGTMCSFLFTAFISISEVNKWLSEWD